MMSDCKDLTIDASGLLYMSNKEIWGQPSAGNYIFTVIDHVMYGQTSGSGYLSTCQIGDSLPTENLLIAALDNNGWLALAESAFDFWDNEQDAIFDNL